MGPRDCAVSWSVFVFFRRLSARSSFPSSAVCLGLLRQRSSPGTISYETTIKMNLLQNVHLVTMRRDSCQLHVFLFFFSYPSLRLVCLHNSPSFLNLPPSSPSSSFLSFSILASSLLFPLSTFLFSALTSYTVPGQAELASRTSSSLTPSPSGWARPCAPTRRRAWDCPSGHPSPPSRPSSRT